MHLRPFTRFVTLLLAAMQFAAPAFVSVVDGTVAKVVRDPVMHVESIGDNECTPPHSADCTVCRYLSGDVAPAPEPAEAAISTEPELAFDRTAQLHGAPAFDYARSRAPPAV